MLAANTLSSIGIDRERTLKLISSLPAPASCFFLVTPDIFISVFFSPSSPTHLIFSPFLTLPFLISHLCPLLLLSSGLLLVQNFLICRCPCGKIRVMMKTKRVRRSTRWEVFGVIHMHINIPVKQAATYLKITISQPVKNTLVLSRILLFILSCIYLLPCCVSAVAQELRLNKYNSYQRLHCVSIIYSFGFNSELSAKMSL